MPKLRPAIRRVEPLIFEAIKTLLDALNIVKKEDDEEVTHEPPLTSKPPTVTK